MSIEFYITLVPLCVLPLFLVSLNNWNKNSEFKRKSYIVIDFDKLIRSKREGDAIDNYIAKLLEIDKVTA